MSVHYFAFLMFDGAKIVQAEWRTKRACSFFRL